MTILLSMFFFAGISLVWHGFKSVRRKRTLLDTAKSKIKSAAQGKVELQGLAWAQNPFLNLNNDLSVFIICALEKYNVLEDTWQRVFDLNFPAGFIIADETAAAWVGLSPLSGWSDSKFDGQVIFNAKNMSLFLKEQEVEWSNLQTEQRKRFIQWAHDASKTMPSDVETSRYRVQYHQILLGSPLSVGGYFSTQKVLQMEVLEGLSEFQKKYEELLRYAPNGIVDASEQQSYFRNLSLMTKQKVANCTSDVPSEAAQLLGAIRGVDHCELTIANDTEIGHAKKLDSIAYSYIIGGVLIMAQAVFEVIKEMIK